MYNPFKRNPVLRFLSSVRLALPLFLIFAFAIAAATFIEARFGSPGARALVYSARWFEVVLGLFIINLTANFFARMPYRVSQYGFVLIHLSVIVILISAGVTRFFGYEGMMPIREGESTDYILSSRDYIQLSSQDGQAQWPVWLYKPGENNLSKTLSLGGMDYKVHVKEFWPHFEEVLAEAEGGQPAISFAAVGAGGMERHMLFEGHELLLGATSLRYHDDGLPESGAAGPLGELKFGVGGQTGRMPVSIDPPATAELAGYRFTIVEFHADYATRGQDNPSTELVNPMVRVSIEGPDGTRGERLLFALFPDFSMGHGGEEDPFEEIDLQYATDRSIDLVRFENKIIARPGFDLNIMDMASAEVDRVIPAGETFELETGILYQAGDLRLVPTDIYESAIWKAGLSQNQNRPAAVNLNIRGPGGEERELLAVRGERMPRSLQLDGRELKISYGPVVIPLDYSIHLDDFMLITYPGSENPASYESHVRLIDKAHGIDGQPVRIYMNHPLTYRGNKHFQSSYDPDRKGTVLSVNHDPGKWPTYIGYMMISLGFLLIFFKEIIWSRPKRKAENA